MAATPPDEVAKAVARLLKGAPLGDAVALRADDYDGVGVFATRAITQGALVLHYTGPVVLPQTEPHSATHSLKLPPDRSVPADQARFRIIDGTWAVAVKQRHLDGPPVEGAGVPVALLGALMNSCRWTDKPANVARPDAETFVGGAAGGDGDAVSRMVAAVPMYAAVDIATGEELLWDYEWRPRVQPGAKRSVARPSSGEPSAMRAKKSVV